MIRLLIVCLLPNLALAATIKNLKFTGDKSAEIVFEGSELKLPVSRTQGNVLELSFPETTLAESLKEKKDFNAPHGLLGRLSIFATDDGGVKARLLINGSTEKLNDRAKLSPSSSGVKLVLAYPEGEGAVLSLLQQEQLPLGATEVAAKKVGGGIQYAQIMALMLLVILGAGGGYFLYRNLKQRGKIIGSRKYLIEQLSHCPLGPKQGVSLLKIGSEFVLVGITPNQITFLSALDKLGKTYESESHLERKDFKRVVEDEYKRIKTNLAAS